MAFKLNRTIPSMKTGLRSSGTIIKLSEEMSEDLSMTCVTKWGGGAAEMCAVIRRGKSFE
jgi:hypothetical protein